MEKIKKELLRILLAIIIFFYTSIPVLAILRIIGLEITKSNYKMLVVYDFISSLVVAVFISALYYDVIINDLKKLKDKCNGKVSVYLKSIMIGFLFLLITKFVSAYVVTIISNLFNIEITTADNQAIIEKMVKSMPLLITLSASLFAPISEEVLFRGGIRKLMNNLGVFVTVSGLIFGLMHVTDNIVFMLEILFIGIIINYLINNKNNKKSIILSVIAIVLILITCGFIYNLEFGNLIIKIKSLNISEVINSISYIALGMYLAYLYIKEDNIIINIGVHALNNILSMIVLLLLS